MKKRERDGRRGVEAEPGVVEVLVEPVGTGVQWTGEEVEEAVGQLTV